VLGRELALSPEIAKDAFQAPGEIVEHVRRTFLDCGAKNARSGPGSPPRTGATTGVAGGRLAQAERERQGGLGSPGAAASAARTPRGERFPLPARRGSLRRRRRPHGRQSDSRWKLSSPEEVN